MKRVVMELGRGTIQNGSMPYLHSTRGMAAGMSSEVYKLLCRLGTIFQSMEKILQNSSPTSFSRTGKVIHSTAAGLFL